MHDWGDMLVQAGFAEPVMDMERITLTFPSPQRLLQELRELGRNLHPGRFQGCAGVPGWRDCIEALAAAWRSGDGAPLSLTFEINYGHAFKPAPRLRAAGREPGQPRGNAPGVAPAQKESAKSLRNIKGLSGVG
jgi:malonyl-CoA O-methyltransferase